MCWKRLLFVVPLLATLIAGGLACSEDDDSTPGATTTITGGSAPTGGAGGDGAGGGAAGGGTGGLGGSAATGGTGGATGGGAGWYQPQPGATWQWQLSDLPADTSYDVSMYDIDLFESEQPLIDALHADGRVVICYFSAGSYESYRPDEAAFPNGVKGNPLDPPWEEELWLDVRDPVVRQIMEARLDLAASKGCDGVEPDNVDGYSNDNGFGLTAADQLDYNRFIAEQAHQRGLSVGLKNDVDQLGALVDDFDWALNEECVVHQECGGYAGTFIAAGKAVFHVEYEPAGQLGAVCAVTQPIGLSTILKHMDLDAWQLPCP